jgi:hypothetical protein
VECGIFDEAIHESVWITVVVQRVMIIAAFGNERAKIKWTNKERNLEVVWWNAETLTKQSMRECG